MNLLHDGLPATGNALIDAAHRRLAGLVAEAARLWLHNAPRQEYLAAIRAFRASVEVHFAEENMILRAAGAANAEHHRKEHRRLIGELDELIEAIEQSDETRNDYMIVDRIESMLFEHELVEDGDYLLHLREDMKSARVPWRDDLAVGIPSVDHHHQVLLDTFNRLVTRIHRGMSKAEILAGLEELASQADVHFPEEEEHLMRMVDASALFRHRLDHSQFLEQLQRLIASYREDKADIKTVVEGYLKYLLIDHITVVDFSQLSGKKPPA